MARQRRKIRLKYDDGSERRLLSRRRKLFTFLLIVVLLKLIAVNWSDVVWNRVLAQFWQWRCLNYHLPEDRIAYVAAPRGTQLPSYLGDFTQGSAAIWGGTVGASPFPVELAEFRQCSAPLVARPWHSMPGPVFLHGLKDSQGRSRLVTVYVLANNPTGWWTAVGMSRKPVPLLREPQLDNPTISTACWPLPRTEADTLLVLAGQPDPNDPSRFTLPIRLNNQRQTITGMLRDDGTIDFTSSTRLSPWTSGRAGGIMLPQMSAAAPYDPAPDNVLLPTD